MFVAAKLYFSTRCLSKPDILTRHQDFPAVIVGYCLVVFGATIFGEFLVVFGKRVRKHNHIFLTRFNFLAIVLAAKTDIFD